MLIEWLFHQPILNKGETMAVYFFEIEVTPTAASTNAADIVSAAALLFVIADSLETAEIRVRSELMDHGWEVREISKSYQPTEDEIADQGIHIESLHQKALVSGLSMILLGNPKIEGHPDDPAQVRSLGSPIIDETKKH